jgi:hypothetical protein
MQHFFAIVSSFPSGQNHSIGRQLLADIVANVSGLGGCNFFRAVQVPLEKTCGGPLGRPLTPPETSPIAWRRL